MQKIVLVGGGTSVSELLSEFQKNRNFRASAIVTVFDDGGSTGKLRRHLKIPAVGDLRKCFSAMAKKDMASLFEYRNREGHAIGNLILAFLAQKYGFQKAIKIYTESLGLDEKVIPVSFAEAVLIGEMEGGSKIHGEHWFDAPPKKLVDKKIKSIKLSPSVKINPQVKQAFSTADKIVVGPGSLFGSLLVHFQVKGFREMFVKSKAKKILVLNNRREFGYKKEKYSEIIQRFPVDFDEVIYPKGYQPWKPNTLIKKIIA